jgi:hypothetical protein
MYRNIRTGAVNRQIAFIDRATEIPVTGTSLIFFSFPDATVHQAPSDMAIGVSAAGNRHEALRNTCHAMRNRHAALRNAFPTVGNPSDSRSPKKTPVFNREFQQIKINNMKIVAINRSSLQLMTEVRDLITPHSQPIALLIEKLYYIKLTLNYFLCCSIP